MQTITLKIEKAVYGGYGLGFHQGKAYFVPYAVPGDNLAVEIYKEKKGYGFGRILEIIDESENRIKPECPNFGICGGCDHLNVSYESELAFKEAILMESLSRSSGLEPGMIPQMSLIKGSRFHYRSHATIKTGPSGKAGFYMKDTNNIIPFPGQGCCLLAEELIGMLSTAGPSNKNELKIACSNTGECFSSAGKQPIIRETENGILFERGIAQFFQSNKFLRVKMLEKAREYTDINSTGIFLDIGCGVGFFTLFLAKHAAKGLGIDTDRESIKWAKHNARLNEVNNVDFKTMPASGIPLNLKKYDIVIADPPRTGLSKKARDAVKALAPRRIVYVSCSPAALARDAGDFITSHYSLGKLTIIDMFPGTHHIEAIALFTKKR